MVWIKSGSELRQLIIINLKHQPIKLCSTQDLIKRFVKRRATMNRL